MITTCFKCHRRYDDANQWTICPHSPLGCPVDDLCPKCDTLKSRHGPCHHQLKESPAMTTEQYEALAMRTEADQHAILQRLMSLGVEAMRLDNASRGLAADAGEVLTAVMRYIEYGRPLDKTNLIEEVGDCLWRLTQVCKAGGFTFQDAMAANIRKLTVRYPDKYSDEQSANRDLAAERAALLEKDVEPVVSLPPEDRPGFNERFFGGHISGKSLVIDAATEEKERRVEMVPTIEQDGHGFGHVNFAPNPPFCTMTGEQHDWELVQTPEGSGYKCRKCGLMGSI